VGDIQRLRLADELERITREARSLVRSILDEEPALSGQEVLARLDDLVAARAEEAIQTEAELVRYTECRHCGFTIMRVGDSAWRHDDAPPMSRGCRAASFDRDDKWDDSLNRTWKATPAKNAVLRSTRRP
jgi:hypothetical protein